MDQRQTLYKMFFSFRGDKELLAYLYLRLYTTINLQKSHMVSVELQPASADMMNSSLTDPILSIETFGEVGKDQFLKNKSMIKYNAVYVFFPAPIRVDDKIYKIYQSNYENFLKEIPKALRGNFCKLIIYEQGVGYHSFELQKSRCCEAILANFKATIYKRIEAMTGEWNGAVGYHTLRTLMQHFTTKNKLALLYRQLNLGFLAVEMLTLLWQDLMFNFRLFVNEKTNRYDCAIEPPFIMRNYGEVARNLETGSRYLTIVTYAFIRMFELEVELLLQFEATKKLKDFVDYFVGNVFTNAPYFGQDLGQSLWIISVLDYSFSILYRNGRVYPTLLNSLRYSEYSMTQINLCTLYRGAVEKVGTLLYNLNTCLSFPTNIVSELQLCLEKVEIAFGIQSANQKLVSPIKWIEVSTYVRFELPVMKKYQYPSILLMTQRFDLFKIVYLKALALAYYATNKSSLKKVAWSIKLTALKAIILYFDLTRETSEEYLKNQYSTGDPAKNEVVIYYIRSVLSFVVQTLLTVGDERVLRRPTYYELYKDNFFNRSSEYQKPWPQLKMVYDLFRFTILAISKQRETTYHGEVNSWSICYRVSFRNDSFMYLLLNPTLFALSKYWDRITMIFKKLSHLYHKIDKGQDKLKNVIEEDKKVKLRLGIITKFSIYRSYGHYCVRIKLNNKYMNTLYYLYKINQYLITIELVVHDKNFRMWRLPLSFIMQDKNSFNVKKMVRSKGIEEEEIELVFAVNSNDIVIFVVKELQIHLGKYLICSYVNKELEVSEMKEIEDKLNRKTSSVDYEVKRPRKYSSIDDKIKDNYEILLKFGTENLEFYYLNTLLLTCESGYQIKQSRFNEIGTIDEVFERVVPVFSNIWTPINFCLKLNYDHDNPNIQSKFRILLNKISITCTDLEAVGSLIKINDHWYDFKKQEESTMPFFSDRADIIVMIKCNTKIDSSPKKASKQIRIRKGSYGGRSRLSSRASIDQGQHIIELTLSVQHGDYTYYLYQSILYIKKKPIDVNYYYFEYLEEFLVRNRVDCTLFYRFKLEKEKEEEEYVGNLLREEEIRFYGQQVQIAVMDLYGDTPKEYHNEIDLKIYVRKELLRPMILYTCELELTGSFPDCFKGIFKRFNQIRIKSNYVGELSVINVSVGYYLVGKVEGCVYYTNGTMLDLSIMPTRVGRLQLPQLLISGKKAVWKYGCYMTVIN